MSQRDLAFLSGVGANTIVSLEKGHPGVAIGTLARVLDAMDLLSEMDHLMQTRRDPALAQYALNHLGACPTFEQGQPQAALAPGLVAVRTLSLKAQE